MNKVNSANLLKSLKTLEKTLRQSIDQKNNVTIINNLFNMVNFL